ncbi:MAG: family 43 glycosylhydrolase [Bacilli bacterium]
MKLNIEQNRSQGDPYVIKVKEEYYMYCTHNEGVHLYSSKDKIDWEYRGICFTKVDEKEYWAPAVIEIDNKYYMYVSTMPINESDTHQQRILVAIADKPDEEFKFIKYILKPFSIDPHVS